MSQHYGIRSAQALYNIFIAPHTIPTIARTTTRRCIRPTGIQQSRSIYRGKPAQREIRKEKWNDEIKANQVIVKDPETGELGAPILKRLVLSRLDLEQERLVQIVQDEPGNRDFIPICKIVNKKQAYDAMRQRQKANKEDVKTRAIEISVKTIEVNWAIDRHDLELRLSRMQKFLSEGRKVEVICASKKKGRRATSAEIDQVTSQIKGVVSAVDGARETKPMEGKVGAVAMFFFQGKAQPKPEVQTSPNA